MALQLSVPQFAYADLGTDIQNIVNSSISIACSLKTAAVAEKEGCPSPPQASAPAAGARPSSPIQHVLMVSVDGLHSVDLNRYIATHPNSNLSMIAKSGVVYQNAYIDGLTDSFPGLMGLVTGATPKYAGVYYDDSYSRQLTSPGSANCSITGSEIEYAENVDVNSSALVTTIDSAKLPLNGSAGCTPTYPNQFVRVNNVFEVAKKNGGYTAWADKHPAYQLLQGPSGHGVDDLYTPEINAITGSLTATFNYDLLHVNAALNQIKGLSSSGAQTGKVPSIFGFNMQVLSVTQKLKGGGYLDAAGTPSAMVASALDDVDSALGSLYNGLRAANILNTTAFIVTAKHGQAPIDPTLLKKIDSANLTNAIAALAPGEPAQATTDDVALVWLNNSANAPIIVAGLSQPSNAASLGIDHIISGAELQNSYGGYADRVPDFIIVVKKGVIYTTGSKVMEHGGFSEDDQHVGLIVSNPAIIGQNFTANVTTTQVAPTILSLLGYPLMELDATNLAVIKPLPGIANLSG